MRNKTYTFKTEYYEVCRSTVLGRLVHDPLLVYRTTGMEMTLQSF